MNTPINKNAPVVWHMTIPIRAEPSKVWQTLTEVNHWSEWRKSINKATLNDELAPGTSFVWQSGGMRIRSRFHTVETEKELGWTGNTLGIRAVHNWKLFAKDGATKVFVAESLEGPWVRWFPKTFAKSLEKEMNQWLKDLKEVCEKNNNE